MTYVPGLKSLNLGGRTFDSVELGNLIYLFAAIPTGGRYSTLCAPNGTGGYTVTAGKTLTMHAMLINLTSSNTATGICPLYGTSDVGMDSASAPTGAVFITGQTSNPIYLAQAQFPGSQYQAIPLKFSVGPGLFPAVKSVSAAANHVVTIVATET